MKRFLRTPSPCDGRGVRGPVRLARRRLLCRGDDRIGRHRQRLHPQSRLQGRTLRGQEAKPDGFGPNAIKEQSLDSSKFKVVPIATVADGVTRHAVISTTARPCARAAWPRAPRPGPASTR